MTRNLELDKTNPTTLLIPGVKDPVITYPVFLITDSGSRIYLNRMRMDESSVIGEEVTFDIMRLSDNNKYGIPILTIFNSRIEGNITLNKGDIIDSTLIGSGLIDTTGTIFESILEGHISVTEHISINNCKLSSDDNNVRAMLVMCNDSLIENTIVNGPLLMMNSAAIYDSIINTPSLSSIGSHSVIASSQINKSFKMEGNIIINKNGQIYPPI